MIDNREYGLVLAGGGTKGAYQVGVWKALKELNINVKGIVGASIGSLNGALFLQDDFKMVEDMYENIKLGNIMNVDGMNETRIYLAYQTYLTLQQIIPNKKELIIHH